MIHILPKIVVWLIVVGAAYLIFGPRSFDSSGGGDPLQNASSQLFLPPAKSERLVRYEQRLQAGQLQAEEFSEYQALAKAHQGSFWEGDGMSVEEALSGVKNHRVEHLASMLAERGLSKEERSVFFTVLKRDHPELLEDLE
jgi:hypothetical protein